VSVLELLAYAVEFDATTHCKSCQISADFSVHPQWSLCLYGECLLRKSTTKSQRTQRWHRGIQTESAPIIRQPAERGAAWHSKGRSLYSVTCARVDIV